MQPDPTPTLSPTTPTLSPTTPTLSRRALLAAGTATGAAGVLVLAGCTKGSSGASGGAGGTAAPGAGGGAADDGAGGGGGPTVLAKVSQVPVGNALPATMDGEPVLISQPTAGTIVTFSAICTHQGCTVAPAGKQFQCPCHGSVYDAATGAVIQGPAVAPLKKVPTQVVDGEVVAGS